MTERDELIINNCAIIGNYMRRLPRAWIQRAGGYDSLEADLYEPYIRAIDSWLDRGRVAGRAFAAWIMRKLRWWLHRQRFYSTFRLIHVPERAKTYPYEFHPYEKLRPEHVCQDYRQFEHDEANARMLDISKAAVTESMQRLLRATKIKPQREGLEFVIPRVWSFLEHQHGVGIPAPIANREIGRRNNLNNVTISRWQIHAREAALTALQAAGYTPLDLV